MSTIPRVLLEHSVTNTESNTHVLNSLPIAGSFLSNLLERNPSQSQWPTDMVPMRTIHHECQAAIHQITAHIQTRDQLDELPCQVDDIACVSHDNFLEAMTTNFIFSQNQHDMASAGQLKGPPVIS